MDNSINKDQETYDYIKSEFDRMDELYKKNQYPSYQERKELLKSLKKTILDNKDRLVKAMNDDYGYRSEFDSLISDVLPTISLLNYTLKNLKKWMKPSKRHTGLLLKPSKIRVHYQPLGVVGVITPWNFPIFLALGPTIQAIAAGNKVLIKMSEDTVNTNQALREILKDFKNDILIIDEIDNSGPQFSKIPFNHFVFTGSTQVGKLVAGACAKNLTPITLELGGKSPTIICDDANLEVAVDSIILGKTINSGQICVAPDYVFIPTHKKEIFIKMYLERYKRYFIDSKSLNQQTHIVNDRQYRRINELLLEVEKMAEVNTIEGSKREERLLLPHLVSGDILNSKLMKEEIFGSILPVITYDNVESVIKYINDNERPLALYIMTKNKKMVSRLLKETHSGGVGVNETAMHVMADDAPFGGVGHSGTGQYHGYEGFQTFSNAKTVLYSPSSFSKSKFVLLHRDFVKKFAVRFLLK